MMSYININLPPKYNYFGSTSIIINMMLKLLLCLLFLNGVLSYEVHEGIHIRDTSSAEDLMKVDLYLRRYGYLIDHMPDTEILASATNREEALKFFQNYNKIPITGKLDKATTDLMEQARCGCPDVMPQKNEADESKKVNPPTPVQFNLGTRWTNNRVSWRLNSFSGKIRRGQVITETRRAFDLWSKAANLIFVERASGNADIVIDFARGNHNDGAGNAFDGVGRVLAHAFFPPFGDTHFDDDERWVVNRTGTDYFTVAAHEFGHALGLGHSEIRQALMAPFYTGYNPNFELNSDDIAGIQALYGPPLNQPPPPTRPPLVTARPPITPTTVQPPTTNRPRFCSMSFNAVVRDFNGDFLAFMGRAYMLRINSNGLVQARSQRTRFRRSPLRPDAAFEVFRGSEIMMLKGRRLVRFDRRGNRIGRLWIVGGGATMPEQPRATISFSSNDVSVFGYSQVWKMSPNTARVVSNSHRYIRNEFPGVPNGLDAAVMQSDNIILFFKGQLMYTFDRRLNRVIRQEDKASRLMPNNCNLS